MINAFSSPNHVCTNPNYRFEYKLEVTHRQAEFYETFRESKKSFINETVTEWSQYLSREECTPLVELLMDSNRPTLYTLEGLFDLQCHFNPQTLAEIQQLQDAELLDREYPAPPRVDYEEEQLQNELAIASLRHKIANVGQDAPAQGRRNMGATGRFDVRPKVVYVCNFGEFVDFESLASSSNHLACNTMKAFIFRTNPTGDKSVMHHCPTATLISDLEEAFLILAKVETLIDCTMTSFLLDNIEYEGSEIVDYPEPAVQICNRISEALLSTLRLFAASYTSRISDNIETLSRWLLGREIVGQLAHSTLFTALMDGRSVNGHFAAIAQQLALDFIPFNVLSNRLAAKHLLSRILSIPGHLSFGGLASINLSISYKMVAIGSVNFYIDTAKYFNSTKHILDITWNKSNIDSPLSINDSDRLSSSSWAFNPYATALQALLSDQIEQAAKINLDGSRLDIHDAIALDSTLKDRGLKFGAKGGKGKGYRGNNFDPNYYKRFSNNPRNKRREDWERGDHQPGKYRHYHDEDVQAATRRLRFERGEEFNIVDDYIVEDGEGANRQRYREDPRFYAQLHQYDRLYERHGQKLDNGLEQRDRRNNHHYRDARSRSDQVEDSVEEDEQENVDHYDEREEYRYDAREDIREDGRENFDERDLDDYGLPDEHDDEHEDSVSLGDDSRSQAGNEADIDLGHYAVPLDEIPDGDHSRSAVDEGIEDNLDPPRDIQFIFNPLLGPVHIQEEQAQGAPQHGVQVPLPPPQDPLPLPQPDEDRENQRPPPPPLPEHRIPLPPPQDPLPLPQPDEHRENQQPPPPPLPEHQVIVDRVAPPAAQVEAPLLPLANPEPQNQPVNDPPAPALEIAPAAVNEQHPLPVEPPADHEPQPGNANREPHPEVHIAPAIDIINPALAAAADPVQPAEQLQNREVLPEAVPVEQAEAIPAEQVQPLQAQDDPADLNNEAVVAAEGLPHPPPVPPAPANEVNVFVQNPPVGVHQPEPQVGQELQEPVNQAIERDGDRDQAPQAGQLEARRNLRARFDEHGERNPPLGIRQDNIPAEAPVVRLPAYISRHLVAPRDVANRVAPIPPPKHVHDPSLFPVTKYFTGEGSRARRVELNGDAFTRVHRPGDEVVTLSMETKIVKGVAIDVLCGSCTSVFPWPMRQYVRVFGSLTHTLRIQNFCKKTRLPIKLCAQFFDDLSDAASTLPAFQLHDRSDADTYSDTLDPMELLPYYHEQTTKRLESQEWSDFKLTKAYELLVKHGELTPLEQSHCSHPQSTRKQDWSNIPTKPIVYPLIASRSFFTAIGDLKLLWINRSNQCNLVRDPRSGKRVLIKGAPLVKSVGVALCTPDTQEHARAQFALPVALLLNNLTTITNGPLPPTPKLFSKRGATVTRDAQGAQRSRHLHNELHRLRHADLLRNPSQVIKTRDELIRSFTSIQPVITSRPVDIATCDKLYKRNHPAPPFEVIHSTKLGPSIFRRHFEGTLQNCYPGGCPDIMNMRCNDVHYYLPDGVFDDYPETDLYTTGINYTHQWPALYRYNWNCGRYRIMPDERISRDLSTYRIDVLTSGSGDSNLYSHPLNNVMNPSRVMDLGWVSFFEFQGRARDMRMHTTVGPNFYSEHLDPQTTWIRSMSNQLPLELTGNYNRNASTEKEIDAATAAFCRSLNSMLKVKGEDMLSVRVDYLCNILGKNTPSHFTFIAPRSCCSFFCRKNQWVIAKTNALDPVSQEMLDNPSWVPSFWRKLLNNRKLVSTFDRDQMHMSNFGGVGPKDIIELIPKIALNYSRTEYTELKPLVWTRPYTNLIQAIDSIEKEKQNRKVINTKIVSLHQLTDLDQAAHRRNAIENEHADPVPQSAKNPNPRLHNPETMIPLTLEVRKLGVNSFSLNDASDNPQNARLVEKLRKNYVEPTLIVPPVKRYPKIGYTASNESLKDISNWTIDHNSPLSMVAAVHTRHFGAQILPDPVMVSDFKEFCVEYIGKIARETNELLLHKEPPLIWDHYASKAYAGDKKDEYIKNCYNQLFQPDEHDFSFSFMGMVKPGEINYSDGELRRDRIGFLLSGTERARLIWNPSFTGKALLNFTQSPIFDILHATCPDFIHGASVSDIRDQAEIRTKRLEDPVSCSLDGSAYDSTQFACLMECVDTLFFTIITPGIHAYLTKLAGKHGAPQWKMENTIRLVKSATDPQATLFVQYPRSWTRGYQMTQEQKLKLSKHWPKSKPKSGNAFAAYDVNGTTFSGHPTKTTLGNTLRTLCYYRYALRHLSNVQMMASGDDIVCWLERKESQLAIAGVSSISSKTADFKYHGLGQVVKKVEIKEKYDIDFCSKNFYYTDTSGLIVTRDVEKLLKTKLSAQTDYAPFVKDPRAYMSLLYRAALVEVPCPLIHELLRKRLNELGGELSVSDKLRDRFNIIHKNNYKQNSDPRFEDACRDSDLQSMIIARSKVHIPDLFDYFLRLSGRIRFGAVKTPVLGINNLLIYHTMNNSYSNNRRPYIPRNPAYEQRRDHHDTSTYTNYERYDPNDGSINRPRRQRKQAEQRYERYDEPILKKETVVVTEPDKKTVTTKLVEENPKHQGETSFSMTSSRKPRRPVRLLSDNFRVPASSIKQSGDPWDRKESVAFDWDAVQKERGKVRNGTLQQRTDFYTNHPLPGTLAPFNQNGPIMQNSANEALSDTDRFMLAKYLPGKIDTPFMNGLSRIPIPTGKYSTSFSLDTAARCINPDSNQFPLGTDPYLLLAYCPALSLSLGTGASTSQPTNAHLSGLMVVQGGLSDTALFTDGFDRVNRSQSLFSLLGTNFDTFSSNGLIFAGQIDLRLMCPAANLVGSMYTGACTLASIPTTGLTFARLIQTSTAVSSGATNLCLRGALVNNALVTTALTPNTNDVFADFSNEIVHYIILQNPVVSINSGLPAPYTIIANAHGNYVWWPTQLDSFANKLGSGDLSSANVATPGQSFLSQAIYTPLLDATKLVGRNLLSTAANVAKGLIGQIPLVGNVLASAMGSVVKMKTRSGGDDNATVWVEKAWANRWVDETERLMRNVQLDVLKDFLLTIEAKLVSIRANILVYPDPLIPAGISWLQGIGPYSAPKLGRTLRKASIVDDRMIGCLDAISEEPIEHPTNTLDANRDTNHHPEEADDSFRKVNGWIEGRTTSIEPLEKPNS